MIHKLLSMVALACALALILILVSGAGIVLASDGDNPDGDKMVDTPLGTLPWEDHGKTGWGYKPPMGWTAYSSSFKTIRLPIPLTGDPVRAAIQRCAPLPCEDHGKSGWGCRVPPTGGDAGCVY